MASMVKHGIKYLEKIHLELGHVMIYGAAHGEYKPRQLKSCQNTRSCDAGSPICTYTTCFNRTMGQGMALCARMHKCACEYW